VQHTGHADVVNVDELARGFRREIDARHRFPDNGVAVDGFHGNVVGEFEADRVVADQLAIGDAAVVRTAHEPVLDRQIVDRNFKPFRSARDQELPGLRRGLAQRHGRDLDGFARDRCALVGHLRCISEHHNDARKGDIELFGDDLSERGADPRTKIDMPVVGGDRTLGRDLDKGLEACCRAGGLHDGQRSLRNLHHQSRASASRPAARIAARMISTCAPQRQRL
jgi:hypothetical protein